jgi:membrane-associated progesterone receptor component
MILVMKQKKVFLMTILDWKEAFTNPLNIGLLLFAGYLLYQKMKPVSTPVSKPVSTPVSKPVVIESRDFTPRELSEFNGVNSSKIYLAIKGKVYDVSSKPEFYGPGSMYENFSGRDTSRGMAKNSFDKQFLTDIDGPIDTLEDLNNEEKESLDEWAAFFTGKYNCVGRLIENK